MVILLVEDDVQVQFLIWKLLKADGFTVLIADSGESALELCRNHLGPVDLLLTDLDLPRIDGLELCKAITAERPRTKAVVMSGALRAREQVSTDGLPFLAKPFGPAALRNCIENTLSLAPSFC